MTPADIFVGTREGLFRLNTGRFDQLADGCFTMLSREGKRWWAVVDGEELQRSDDGARWEPVGRIEGLQFNSLLPTPRGLLIGTSEAHLFLFREGSFTRLPSFDTAPGRDGWYNPAADAPQVRSLTQSPSGVLFANVHVGGVLRSQDSGASWAPTLDVNADVHQVLFDASSQRLLVSAARGFGMSDERGEHWRFENEGLHATYLRAIAVAGDTVLVTASTGPFSRNGAVYRKPLRGGAPFERCQQGLPSSFPENLDTFWLTASGPAVALGTSAGHVYLSLDEGLHWSLVAEGLPPTQCVVFCEAR